MDLNIVYPIVLIVLWDVVWKGFALWKAGRNNDKVWFICLMIFNTIGVLPLLYLFVFSKRNNEKKVIVNDLMQQGYVYYLVEPIGKNFDPDFKPELTPKEMLELGVFGGKYMTDCRNEFPSDWYKMQSFPT